MPLTFADTVTPEKVAWLWPGYIPFGKVTMLDGDPGLGKSTILIDLAARLSRAAPLPNGKVHPPMGTILLMVEDEAGDTIVPRLINAQADLCRIALQDKYPDDAGNLVTARFPNHINNLEEDIIIAQAGLVVIDPIMACLGTVNGREISANNDQQVRDALMPLKDLAAKTGAAIVLLRHLNKGTGTSALYRGGGSIAFVGVARSGLIVARDPDDTARVVLASTKSNLGPPPPALTYRLTGCENGAARIDWEGHSAHTAETLVQTANPEEHGALQDAVSFLRDVLADGPMLAKTVQRQAKDAQVSDRTLRRAREQLGITRDSPWIKKASTQDGQYTWELPKQDAQQGNVANQDGGSANLATLDTLNIYIDNVHGQYQNESGQIGQVDQPPPHGHTHPEKQNQTPFNAPRVVKAGRYECAHCYKEVWLSEGAPQLCPQHRRGLDLTGEGAD